MHICNVEKVNCPNEHFTARLQAKFCLAMKTICICLHASYTQRCVESLSRQPLLAFVCLLASTKRGSFYTMEAIQLIMTTKAIKYINIVTLNQCCLSGFAVQIDGGFSYLEVEQIKETCSQPGRSPRFKH